LNSGKQKISTKRASRIIRIHNWVCSAILAVVLPAIVIAIDGYRNVWDVIFLFGGCALLAWTIYWTNWVNSIIFTIGVPAIIIVIAIMGHRSVSDVIFLFICCGFIVWSRWFWLWVKKEFMKISVKTRNRTTL